MLNIPKQSPIWDSGTEGLEEELADELGGKVHAEHLESDTQYNKRNDLVVLSAVLGSQLDAGR
jgi:hypothetical protein